MLFMLRWTIRLGVLALAGYGAKVLYEKYASKAPELREPSREFLQRSKEAVSGTAQRVSDAARDMTGELKHAADDAAGEASRRFSDRAGDDADAGIATPSQLRT
jgi:hypothetical protein